MSSFSLCKLGSSRGKAIVTCVLLGIDPNNAFKCHIYGSIIGKYNTHFRP